jgi:hypothetical protein
MFVTCRPRGTKPQVNGAQGPASRPNPMAGRSDFELVQAKTWPLCSQVGSEENPMPASRCKPGGVADRLHGWLTGHPSPPNRLN